MRTLLAALVAGLLLVSGSSAAANPPLQEWEHVDVDVRLNGASNVCGFEVRAHFEGDTHFIVFFDRDGNIIREVDTAPSFKTTVYAPSTGKSYTSTSPAVLTQFYTNGAVVGSPVIAVITGLVERIPGVDLDGGRFVFNAVVIRHDAAGVPIIQFTSEISSTGPDLEGSIAAARCAAVS
ncbi:MAG TPA: hypothetical protein VJ726_04665 [Candidatus Limnocylindria bacterium]|nr:hypothetical protein [Candidatus Limnocylindria bacterium]